MKRKTTELEESLINDGWYLSSKEYEGKHSEKTSCYEYTKCVPYDGDLGFQAIVRLDPTREKILNIGIPNVYIDKLDDEQAAELHNRFLFLKDYVIKITQKSTFIKDKENRTLEDLTELTARERFEIEQVFGTNDLEKISNIKHNAVELLKKLPKKVNIVKILKVMAENDLCQGL